MRVLLFEDKRTGQLAPITTSRPAFAISCASYRLVDWVRQLDLPIFADVRQHLRRIQSEDFSDLQIMPEAFPLDEAVLAINARMVPSRQNFEAIRRVVAAGKSVVSRSMDATALVMLQPQDAEKMNALGKQSTVEALCELELQPCDENLALLDWPHQVVQWHMQLMNDAMETRIASGDYRQLQDGVFVAPDVAIGDHCVMDTADGPIVLDSNVRVGPYCFFSGPVYAGPRARVIEHAAIKDAVALGHTVKIGGEVEASVIEPYTNKQHHGFLGHSYLGSWINLGAGTCNSDLKNTYGKINIEYGGNKVPSGMQFLGCIIGDYAKTAINTGIFTGKVIGVCSMLYGFVTQNVPSFVNYAQIFGQVAEIPADVMIATQARMFSRRSVTQRECDIDLIRVMYEQTSAEREQTNQIAAF